MPAPDLLSAVVSSIDARSDDLVAWRRRIHMNPETAFTEHETAAFVEEVLIGAGLSPRRVAGTGVVVDLGPDPRRSHPAPPNGASTPADRSRRSGGRHVPGGRLALRADMDALPIPETTRLPFASKRRGAAHACGHDIHTTALLGATLALAELDAAGRLARGVRAIFQPAEEAQPSGARTLVEHGVLEGVGGIFALHCDPKLDVGRLGSRIGAITAASDAVTVHVRSDGGHTSRPHLTGDVVNALATVVTGLPAVLRRRLDPRIGVDLTFGAIQAGTAANAMPSTGVLRGTLRCLDADAWQEAGALVEPAVRAMLQPFGVEVDVEVLQGIPPVVNDERATRALDRAAKSVLGEDSTELTEQSLGGEDFAWYLRRVPGALARLGTRTPGGTTYDLHRGDAQFDERALAAGAKVLAGVALTGASDASS
ncbi:amidohydrolase [Georgenia sp. Z1344]|uniref:amidohydrolase n=1 Tax=Georgenia sp. Z1344 TaxID=3416706 RepID=UPI003CEE1DF5